MIIHANILDWAASYDGPLFHALLCDPPYHLTEVVKRFGKPDSAPVNNPGTRAGRGDDPYARAARGFMGKTWDGGDIAFRPETWATIARVLHPGAFGMAFAGSRGWHRLACAIEDAGLLIHPTIFCWGYGQGFPKATRVKYETCQCAGTSTQTKHYMSDMPRPNVSPPAHAESGQGQVLQPGMPEQSTPAEGAMPTARYTGSTQRVMEGRSDVQTQQGQLHRAEVYTLPSDAPGDGASRRLHNGASASHGADMRAAAEQNGSSASSRPQHAKQQTRQSGAMAGQSQPQSDGAQRYCDRCGKPFVNPFGGHRYGGQALKPSIEPIIVFQKPYDGRPVECITRTGAGALNIDGSRIGTADDMNPRDFDDSRRTSHKFSHVYKSDAPLRASSGAVPDGRWPANLVLSHHPDCNGVCAPDCPVQRLGEQSGELPSGGNTPFRNDGMFMHGQDSRTHHYAETGTAARFFFQADYMAERLEAADQVIYEAKADRSEREAGLDPRQVRLLGMMEVEGQESSGIYDNESAEGAASRGRRPRHGFDESTINDGRAKSIDNPYQRGETARRNVHPTIKPIALARHLATLLLPPDLYAPRRLLIPFAGAGSEMIGALLAGWEEIVGVELEADHCRIAEARLAYWQQRRHEFLDPSKPITAALSDAPDGQRDMFGDDL